MLKFFAAFVEGLAGDGLGCSAFACKVPQRLKPGSYLLLPQV